MRADDYVDATLAQQFENLALLTLRSEPAQHFDPHRIIEHALTKDFEVLLREHGCGREHGDLSAVHDRFEGGAECNFGFAEPNVAANQSVQRPRLLHVDLRVDDRFHLIGGLAKWKRMLEFALPFRIRTERVAGNGFAFGLDGEHFSGVIENG